MLVINADGFIEPTVFSIFPNVLHVFRGQPRLLCPFVPLKFSLEIASAPENVARTASRPVSPLLLRPTFHCEQSCLPSNASPRRMRRLLPAANTGQLRTSCVSSLQCRVTSLSLPCVASQPCLEYFVSEYLRSSDCHCSIVFYRSCEVRLSRQ